MENYESWLHSIGVCVNCRNTDSYTLAGRWLCQQCEEKKNQNARRVYRENRDVFREKMLKKYKDHKEQGLCRWCNAPAYNGRSFCKKHLYMNRMYRERQREREKLIGQKTANQCLWCDAERVRGYKFCEKHLAQKREVLAKAREKRDMSTHIWATMGSVAETGRVTDGK